MYNEQREQALMDAADPYERLSPFYDLALDGFDADLGLYEPLARRVDAPVLELGVGTGRVALGLARRGLRVVGIDRSRAMLAIAGRRAEAEGLLAAVELRCDDVRRPAVRRQFGLIICALDTFLHLESSADQLATLAAARERLADGGVLAIDLPGPAAWGDWEPGARPLVLDWTRRLGDRTISRLSSYRADGAAQTRHVTDIFDELLPDGTLRRHTVEYPLRFVFPAELELLLQRAGLRLKARYGDYELGPFDAASERMIALATE